MGVLNNWEFQEGDDVPSWMLDAEPETPGGPRPSIKFSADVTVVEHASAYWVLPSYHFNGDSGIVINDENSYIGEEDTTVKVFCNDKAVVFLSRCLAVAPPDEPGGSTRHLGDDRAKFP